MAAYVVVVTGAISDPTLMNQYKEQARELLAEQGVSFMAGPVVAEILEGSPPNGAVIIRFETLKQAQDWYRSDEYQKLAPMRLAASSSTAFILEGP
ncbi:DUF1330 domain-containing protein [Henriciella mobilis]|uniref:DUF1330 domain-containing protein n=1 Tax=Hyphomonas oceanitis SCH89 TaxID=1280953 RepID=A0A059G2B0_9PROT|nr:MULTISPECIES: DUF1330 domain-containing protein [Hyphomonadaceae]KDA00864.1 hypothetical protein HOC_18339 [Hyphomonas oceanitis SCH89]RIJ16632.1 DUF1330 domain-containing protein [Henriciella mobilis]RIJ20126.1 DUF1330 domain-containing protein [Henriciella mobilis]|tara:strand:- start:2618 stop:2905 length:288 start_codon:yes stop_codon:yes gene_type:complete